jgi:hypothetical protein
MSQFLAVYYRFCVVCWVTPRSAAHPEAGGPQQPMAAAAAAGCACRRRRWLCRVKRYVAGVGEVGGVAVHAAV